MSLFFVLAFLLLAISLAILLRGLFAGSPHAGSNPVDVNVEIARENKQALETALSTGEMTQEQFDEELLQLETSLASNIKAAPQKTTNTRGQWFAGALILLGVPLAAGLMYLKLGEPAAITAVNQQQASAAAGNTEAMPPLEELLPDLERRLQENPDDVRGWKLLGRSYLMVGQFDKAAEATRQALSIDAHDPDTNAQLAEAIAMQQQGDMRGEPTRLAKTALAIDPNHQQATWLAAIADQQSGEHQAAIEKFEKLLPGTAGDANAQASINEMLAASRAALGESTTDSSNSSEAAGVVLSVKAELSADIAVDLPDTTPLFIYARASNGPPMPLAVARLQLKDLPAEVTLDDSMAMIPQMTLSAFDSVVIGARLSPSGNAIRQTGDWMGETDAVSVSSQTDPVTVVIDTQVE